jgi:hypothetical protein
MERHTGSHLAEITDVEEFVEAYAKWLVEVFPKERITTKP